MLRERRNLYLFYTTAFFIFLNFNITQAITPIYILKLGGTEFFAGLQSTLFYLTAVVLRFYFGPLADKIGNKRTVFIGGLAFMTAPLLLLLNQSVGYILLVRMYQAIGLAAYFPSASALVAALAPRERLGAHIGFYRLVAISTLLLGPSLALKIIDGYSYFWYHLIGFSVGFIALVILHFVQEPAEVDNVAAGKKSLPSINMIRLLKEKNLSPIYQKIFLVSICFGLVQTFTAIFVKQSVPGVNAGIFFTLFGIGSIASNLIIGCISDRKGRATVVFPCLIILGLGMAAFYFLPANRGVLYIGSILTGFGHAGCMTVLITWIIDEAPLARRTTALALQDNIEDIGIAFGSFLFGVLIPRIGMPRSHGLCGGLLILFAVWKVQGYIRKKYLAARG